MKYRVVVDEQYQYRRLEPRPAPSVLDAFYENEYYELVKQGGRAPELRRIMEGGAIAAEELAWLKSTLWQDIVDLLRQHGLDSVSNPRLVDVGCGTGHFATFFSRATGFEAVGIEPSVEASTTAHSLGLKAYPSVRACLDQERPFQAATLLNVLEHVSEPVAFLREVYSLLAEDGLLLVTVPNDFSVLQTAVQEKLGKNPWWIAPPDHVNYFDFESLAHVLQQSGYTVLDRTSTFPMELFLAFGEDYVGNPQVGAACHKKRVHFEQTVPQDFRRQLYRCFAQLGIGRNAVVIARRV